MKCQRKSSKLGEKHFVKGRENPQWSNYQRNSNHKWWWNTHKSEWWGWATKGRALEDRQPNEDYVLKCHTNTRGTLAQLPFGGQRICTSVKHSHSLWRFQLCRNLQEMIHGTTHVFSFLCFWFLMMIPSTFASAKIFNDTHSPILEDNHSTSAMPRNIKELVR